MNKPARAKPLTLVAAGALGGILAAGALMTIPDSGCIRPITMLANDTQAHGMMKLTIAEAPAVEFEITKALPAGSFCRFEAGALNCAEPLKQSDLGGVCYNSVGHEVPCGSTEYVIDLPPDPPEQIIDLCFDMTGKQVACP